MGDNAKRGSRSLAEAHPELAAEWHPSRNGTLTPRDVSRSTSRVVWWQCPAGHEWEASVNNRERQRGCPFCGGKRALAGFNDLATVEPEIAAEWHPTRNGSLTPQAVTAGSGKRVWWLCAVGADHEWPATIANRTTESVRSGCAVCAGRRVVPSTALSTKFPKVAAEWHPTRNGDLSADQVTPYVTKRVWWRCARGHEWQTAISARTRIEGATGCPACSGRVAITGETDLATLHPDLAKEWHPSANGTLTPDAVRPGSNRVIWWKCDSGHEWKATPVQRVRTRSGCPFCAGQRPIAGVNDLATTNPELAAQLHPTMNDGLTARDLMGGSTKRVWWACLHGHSWRTSPDGRSKGSGCPICANKKVLAGYNDIATTNPQLADELHPTLNPKDVAKSITAHSAKKVWWQCSAGHDWQSTVANRALGNGCPVCANKRALPGFNDLATTDPDVADEWHPTRNGGLTPDAVTAGSNKSVWWQCPLGHEWKVQPHNRTANGTGCPTCSNRQVLAGFNDLATTHPELEAEWHSSRNGDLRATDVVAGSARRVWWRCKHGHEWRTSISQRSGGTNCPSCSMHGFSRADDAWMYLVTHDQWQMQQIGITNNPEQRIATHTQNGWDLIDVRGPMLGDLAASLERDALEALRRRGAKIGARGDKVRFDGYTEAWPSASLRAESLAQILRLLYEDE